MKFKQISLSTIILAFSINVNAATVVTDASGMILEGFDGIFANGTEYNVRFMDGTIEELFGVSPFDLDFPNDPIGAQAASLALQATWEALADTSLFDWDQHIKYPEGITESGVGWDFITPYAFQFPGDPVYATAFYQDPINLINEQQDYTGLTTNTDLRDSSYAVYAIWQPAVVPVPAAVWLFGSGLLGLIGIARRNKS